MVAVSKEASAKRPAEGIPASTISGMVAVSKEASAKRPAKGIRLSISVDCMVHLAAAEHKNPQGRSGPSGEGNR
jgi:hypothetical protein